MCGKFMRHLTKNMNRGVANANEIELQGGKIQILKLWSVKSKQPQTLGGKIQILKL